MNFRSHLLWPTARRRVLWRSVPRRWRGNPTRRGDHGTSPAPIHAGTHTRSARMPQLAVHLLNSQLGHRAPATLPATMRAMRARSRPPPPLTRASECTHMAGTLMEEALRTMAQIVRVFGGGGLQAPALCLSVCARALARACLCAVPSWLACAIELRQIHELQPCV